jgi:hypothetical protein
MLGRCHFDKNVYVQETGVLNIGPKYRKLIQLKTFSIPKDFGVSASLVAMNYSRTRWSVFLFLDDVLKLLVATTHVGMRTIQINNAWIMGLVTR